MVSADSKTKTFASCLLPSSPTLAVLNVPVLEAHGKKRRQKKQEEERKHMLDT